MAFFFPEPINDDPAKISRVLQQSLSKALTYYYPFAGIVRDNAFVDCNDMGAEFFDVRVNCRMSDILNCNETSAEDCVFPQGPSSVSCTDNSFEGTLLKAQVTHFDCGGVAVSASISHKVVDGYSLTNFISDWAAMAREPSTEPSPRFDGESFFPPIHITNSTTSEKNNAFQGEQRHVTRRYLFPASALNTLKARVSADSGIENPTRVEIVTALLHKCAAAARRAISGGSFQPSAIMLFASLRPPFPLDTIGNASAFIVTSTNKEVDMNLPRLVAELREGKEKLRNRFNTIDPNKLVLESFETWKEAQQVLKQDGYVHYCCSSLCNFPSNMVDFGWGRPHRVTVLNIHPFSFFLLMDSQSGNGVEALVTLEEADMTFFQENKELLQFTCSIPHI